MLGVANCLCSPYILGFLNNIKIQYGSLLRFAQLYMLLMSVDMAILAIFSYSAASSSSLFNSSSLLLGFMKVAT